MSDVTRDTEMFTARDDRFHFDELGDDWWATETSWFSFHHRERRLGGWFYTLARPNIGTLAGGAWVWDPGACLPWEVLYSANFSALPLPRDQDLDDCTLPTGVAIKVIEPGNVYSLGYADGDRFSADLRFEGVMPPHPLTAVGSTFGAAHHFDQFGRVSGSIVVNGERVAIDCIGMRDRTWGRRPEDRPRRAAYVTGAAGPLNGFLAVTNVRDGNAKVAYGFLRRDGVTRNLAGGTRDVVRDRERGWVNTIRIAATDVTGRRVIATGVPVSRIVINRHTFIDVNSLVRWDIDGVEAWGEDQDMWPVHEWAARQREACIDGGPASMNATDLLQRIATTLREDVGPAVEAGYPRTQAFMAAVVLQKLGRELALADTHQRAETIDLQQLRLDLHALLDDTPVPEIVRAAVQRFATTSDPGSLAELITALYAARTELGESRFETWLGRIRHTLRAQLDRRLESAR